MSVIGIDLGTTNTCVAVMRNKVVEVIANDLGLRVTPSCVAITEDERYIGNPAVSKLVKNPKNTVYDVKRMMGREFNDPEVQEDMKRWQFKVVDVEGKPRIQVEYRKETKTFAPEEISAMVLGKIKEMAEKFVGGEVTGAVITVPAAFNNAQRQATVDAGRIAGLNVISIINEPTAAALAYGFMKEPVCNSKILVYDLGGGTLDVSIVSIESDSVFNVLASCGDTHLGGGDFDNKLIEYLQDKFLKVTGINICDNEKSKSRLKLKAEESKKTLSAHFSSELFIECFIDNKDFDTNIFRATFEDICSDLFYHTLIYVKQALFEAELEKSDIDEVVLVGGSSRIPMIRKILQDLFPDKTVQETVNADEAVATGAAVYASIISGKTKINEITSLALGIKTKGGLFDVVIPKNTRIPCRFTQTYHTARRNQTDMAVKVYEGELSNVDYNNFLGSVTVSGIPKADAEKEYAEVTLDLNASGILTVSAKSNGTSQSWFTMWKRKNMGTTTTVEINMKERGLSEKEIKRMMSVVQSLREDDECTRKLLEEKNDIARQMVQVENSLRHIEVKKRESLLRLAERNSMRQ